MNTARLAWYGLAMIVVVVALLMLIAALPSHPPRLEENEGNTEVEMTATSVAPVVLEPANPTPTYTPSPSPTFTAL